jgi:muramoyltetrapeptide carboxypeptidase
MNTQPILKGRALKPGMTLGLIAPSGPPKDPAALDRAQGYLESQGYRVRIGPNARKKAGYLAGNDRERLSDLHWAFESAEIDGILCVRGGYGASRIASSINYDLCRRNPKVLVGFSDITYLHLALWKMCGLVGVNGPMATSTFAGECVSAFSEQSLWRTISEAKPAGSIWQGCPDRDFRVVREGSAEGRLIGGNLSLVAAACGTQFSIDAKDAIIFLEDVDERAYRVDRMLTQLLASGCFEGARAIVFGRNVIDPQEKAYEDRVLEQGLGKQTNGFPQDPPDGWTATLDEVIHDRLCPLGIPVLIGLPFGHNDEYASIPVGVLGRVDTRTGELEILESAVRD